MLRAVGHMFNAVGYAVRQALSGLLTEAGDTLLTESGDTIELE